MSCLTGLVLIVSLESELRFAACGRNREHLKQHEYKLGYCSLVQASDFHVSGNEARVPGAVAWANTNN